MEEIIDLVKLSELAENLRKNVIGDPIWIEEKQVYEYSKQTVEIVVILKLLRAIQGLKSQLILCEEGLFIDMGVLFRCVKDCIDEIRFLLEKYPEQSKDVKQFIKKFFEDTIGDYDSKGTNSVKTKKIHSANVRYLTGQDMNEKMTNRLKILHKIGCGYIHANYISITESYDGLSFNLLGVPCAKPKSMRQQIVQDLYISVLIRMSEICKTFKQDNIKEEVEKLLSLHKEALQ